VLSVVAVRGVPGVVLVVLADGKLVGVVVIVSWQVLNIMSGCTWHCIDLFAKASTAFGLHCLYILGFPNVVVIDLFWAKFAWDWAEGLKQFKIKN